MGLSLSALVPSWFAFSRLTQLPEEFTLGLVLTLTHKPIRKGTNRRQQASCESRMCCNQEGEAGFWAWSQDLNINSQ